MRPQLLVVGVEQLAKPIAKPEQRIAPKRGVVHGRLFEHSCGTSGPPGPVIGEIRCPTQGGGQDSPFVIAGTTATQRSSVKAASSTSAIRGCGKLCVSPMKTMGADAARTPAARAAGSDNGAATFTTRAAPKTSTSDQSTAPSVSAGATMRISRCARSVCFRSDGDHRPKRLVGIGGEHNREARSGTDGRIPHGDLHVFGGDHSSRQPSPDTRAHPLDRVEHPSKRCPLVRSESRRSRQLVDGRQPGHGVRSTYS